MEENNKKNYFNFSLNKKLKWLVLIIFVLFLLIVAFKLGTYWGYKKATFLNNWWQGYQKNFGPMGYQGGFFNKMKRFDKDFMFKSYGLSGKVILIKDNSFILEDKDGFEKIVLVLGNTIFKKNGWNIKFTDLKEGDFVIVIGLPNQNGEIEAKLIRVF